MTTGARGPNSRPFRGPPTPQWRCAPTPPPGPVSKLERELKLPPALCRLLVVRGCAAPGDAKSFLRPMLSGLHDPRGLQDAQAAAERIVRAIQSDEAVVVHGDYDADGITGAALLASWIRDLGGRAQAMVPERLTHGYDLTLAGVKRAKARGARLLVTVDCGIRALEAVRFAKGVGIDVVVTDHHAPGPHLPEACAVVNPHRPDCGYPNKMLAGAGVAFKVGQLVADMLGRSEEEAWPRLDLVAVATIADQVDLEGENRILVRYGLRAVAETRRPGLRALLERAGVKRQRPVDAEVIAYRVAPRINAAGRVGTSVSALRLLLTDREDEARDLARELEANNTERRAVERRTTDEALVTLEASCDPDRDAGVVVVGEGWHPGVIGIVASRLTRRVFRPVVVIGLDGDSGRGSARSIPGFNILEAISACREHLDRFGGHKQAAGLDIRRDQVDLFREAFGREARRQMGQDQPRPEIRVDAEVGLGEIDADLSRYLRYVGPFGRGNPQPVFAVRGVGLDGPVQALRGGHLRFRMVEDGHALDAIGFNLAERCPPATLQGEAFDVAFGVLEDDYRGVATIKASVLDLRVAA